MVEDRRGVSKGVDVLKKEGKITSDTDRDGGGKEKRWWCKQTHALKHCLCLCFFLSAAAN